MSLVLILVAAPAHAQRPAPGSGYADGISLYSLDSLGERFRVWYVTESVDAVDPADIAPADETPDFAVEVAAVAEDNHRLFIDELGFRPPLVDSDYLPPEQVGGDSRFDIYLVNFANADGQYLADACVSERDWCLGHVRMENDFAGFGYPSDALAIRTLVSHEYFHAIQYAYATGHDAKWAEGTAVWAEEVAFPEQDDFERLIRRFLEKPYRPFDRTSTSAFDGYPYGAGLWARFLDERFGGPDIIRQIWEALDQPDTGGARDFLTATDEILQSQYGSSLAEAWVEFTRWNLHTGERADASRAYSNGAAYESVAVEEPLVLSAGELAGAEQQTEGMSARYTPIQLPDLGGAARELAIVTASGKPAVAAAYLWQDGVLGDARLLEPDPENPQRARVELSWQGTPTLYLVVTSVSRGAPMRTVTVSMSIPEIADPPPPQGDGGCRLTPSSSGSPGGTLIVVLALVLVLVLWRRPPIPAI